MSGTRHQISGEPLSFEIPDDWDLWRQPDGLVFLASAPENADPFEAQILVTKEVLDDVRTSMDYLLGNYVSLKEHLNGFVDRGAERFEVAGVEVGSLRYSATIDAYEVSSMDFYVLTGNVAYIIQCKAHIDDFSRWESTFANVGASIVINA